MNYKIAAAAALCAISFGFLSYAKESAAAAQNVSVTLPSFAVTLNGNQIDNAYREYPLFVYKDITYVPMTWHDSRLLGLETNWTSQDGLAIAQGNVASSYRPAHSDRSNPVRLQATIPSFPITVNGVSVDNAKEQYPLLNYNNVTYFPLTWRFAHDEFGWLYEWDHWGGLFITSDNPKITTVDLPKHAGDNGVAVYQGYYYFTETSNGMIQVYRAPLDHPSLKEPVYSDEADPSNSYNNYTNFEIRNGELWLSYHVGGMTMGADKYVKISDNGEAALKHMGYLDFEHTPLGTLIIDQSLPPRGNNLLWKPEGEKERDGKAAGDPDLIYGWHVTPQGMGTSYYPDRNTGMIGEQIYVLASPYRAADGELNRIYKVNATSNETEMIVHSEVRDFKVRDHKLYYVKQIDGLLYAANLDGSGEQRISDHEIGSWYEALGGNVYYTAAKAKGLYKADPSIEDLLVLEEAIGSIQITDDKMVVKLSEEAGYGMKIVDRSGELLLSVADQVANFFAYDDVIVIVMEEDRSIASIE